MLKKFEIYFTKEESGEEKFVKVAEVTLDSIPNLSVWVVLERVWRVCQNTENRWIDNYPTVKKFKDVSISLGCGDMVVTDIGEQYICTRDGFVKRFES